MQRHGPSPTGRGRLAETIAAAYLQLCGYQILGRNIQVGALEVDLVAAKEDLLVVVEVRLRARASAAPDAAQAWVPPEKWRRMQHAASRLTACPRANGARRTRVDLILVTQTPLTLHLRHVVGCPPRRPAD